MSAWIYFYFLTWIVIHYNHSPPHTEKTVMGTQLLLTLCLLTISHATYMQQHFQYLIRAQIITYKNQTNKKLSQQCCYQKNCHFHFIITYPAFTISRTALVHKKTVAWKSLTLKYYFFSLRFV